MVLGAKASTSIGNYDPNRDLATGLLDKSMEPALIKSLKDASVEKRVAAARGLGVVGSPGVTVFNSLLDCVRTDSSSEARLNALAALASFGAAAKTAVPALEAAMKDSQLTQQKEILAKVTELYNRLK